MNIAANISRQHHRKKKKKSHPTGSAEAEIFCIFTKWLCLWYTLQYLFNWPPVCLRSGENLFKVWVITWWQYLVETRIRVISFPLPWANLFLKNWRSRQKIFTCSLQHTLIPVISSYAQVAGWTIPQYSEWLDDHIEESERVALIRLVL